MELEDVSTGNGERNDHRSKQSHLPAVRQTWPEIEAFPIIVPGRCCCLLRAQRSLNPRPKRRGFLIVAQFRGGGAQLLPGAQLFRARGTRSSMLFQGGPLFGRAIQENPFAVVTSNAHCAPPAPEPRGGSSNARRFFFAWKSVFLEAVSEIASILAISACRKPSTS